MNVVETLRALMRRWYITFPGIILAGVLAVGVFMAIPPSYERSSSQLLLPDNSSVPEGGNPYLYISGLSQAADVLVRAAGSENVLADMQEAFPGSEIEVTRDVTTSSPIVVVTATARTDADAGAIIDQMIAHTTTTLDALQAEEGIEPDDRITVTTLTVDQKGVVVQKTRLMISALVGVAGILFAILLAALVEGLSSRRRRRRPSPTDVAHAAPIAAEAELDELDDLDDLVIPDEVSQVASTERDVDASFESHLVGGRASR